LLAQRRLDAMVLDAPVWFDFTASDTAIPIMTRRVGLQDFDSRDSIGPYQITYNFSRAVRKNKFPVKFSPYSEKASRSYGASNFSFRVLYEFLCEVCNNGVPFIDTYFERIFKTRPVYAEFQNIWSDINEDIAAEQQRLFQGGRPRDEKGRFMSLKAYSAWRDPIIKQDCKRLADKIRSDIQHCLVTGKLPLRGKQNPVISKMSEKVRSRLGGMQHTNRLFYASGQLINNLNIFVEIGDAAA